LKPFDTHGQFRPFAEDGALRRIAVRGAGITIFSSGASVAVQMISTVILSRLLTPRDFGVVTMVTTFSLLFLNFGLSGFTEAVLQRQEISHQLASNLFWICVAVGTFLTVAFASAGSLMAWFYGDHLVNRVAVGVAFSIVFTSFSVLHLALLKRAMSFTVVSINDVFARAFGVAVSIALSLRGWGYWALVAGIVAVPISTLTGALLLCRWVPSLPRRASGTGDMTRFALHTYGRFSVNYFARNLDNVLVGWRFNAQALGFYKKAYDLFALSASQLVSPLTVVAVSALSRLRNNKAQYRRYLLGAVGVIGFVGMGLSAILTLAGKDIIRLLLGPRWDEAGRIFTFFGPGIGIMLIYYTHGWIHLSIGRADRWFRWGMIEFAVTGASFLVGLHWGPVGVAAAWTISFWILTGPSFSYAGKPIDIGFRPIFGVIWRYIVAAVISGLISIRFLPFLSVGSSYYGSMQAFIHVVTDTVVFGFLYLAAVIVLHRGFGPLITLKSLLMDVRPRRSSLPLPVSSTVENSVPVSAVQE
jgi:O-antigen/teichoic acid export membrane protein